MSSLDENKRIVQGFIRALDTLDVCELRRRLDQDAKLETTGDWSASGVRSTDQFIRELSALHRVLPGGLGLRLISITAEDDRIVVELEGGATTSAGENYSNHYCQIYRIKDGKIVTFREYMDSALAERLIFPLLRKR